MLPIETHAGLMKEWQGRIYATPERLCRRTHHLELLLPLLSGKDVLEIGCNAGITAREICRYARSYIGLEPDRDYYLQFIATRKHIENKNVEAHNMALPSFLGGFPEKKFNALVICVALYLLGKEEIGVLTKRVLPKCDIVIIQERKAKRPSGPDYNPYCLHKAKNILKLLDGFDADVYYSKKERYFEVIGVRN